MVIMQASMPARAQRQGKVGMKKAILTEHRKTLDRGTWYPYAYNNSMNGDIKHETSHGVAV